MNQTEPEGVANPLDRRRNGGGAKLRHAIGEMQVGGDSHLIASLHVFPLQSTRVTPLPVVRDRAPAEPGQNVHLLHIHTYIDVRDRLIHNSQSESTAPATTPRVTHIGHVCPDHCRLQAQLVLKNGCALQQVPPREQIYTRAQLTLVVDVTRTIRQLIVHV